MIDKYICPCLIADEPCQKGCSCANPHMSRACLCCARYGSDEQRKAAANYIVGKLRKLKKDEQ